MSACVLPVSGGREIIATNVFGWRFATSSMAFASLTICSHVGPLQPRQHTQSRPSSAFAHASYPFTFSSKVSRSTASFDWHQITPGQPPSAVKTQPRASEA